MNTKEVDDKLKLAGIRMVSEESKRPVEVEQDQQQISSLAEHFPESVEESKSSLIQEESKVEEKPKQYKK